MDPETTEHQRVIVRQFTRQAVPFRNFAELPGHDRDLVLAATELAPDDTVLDVACGPGVATCDLAEVAHHATGIDITPAMIEQANELQRTRGLTNLTWNVAAVPPLPFPDDSFSLVYTRHSFHHFPDPLSVLTEMVRACKTDGRVVVVDVFMSTPQQAKSFNHMEKLRDPSHVRALLLDELEELLSVAGLRNVKTLFYKQPMALERLLKGSFPNPGDEDRIRQIFTADVENDELGLAARWDDGDIHFVYPIVVLVGWKS